MSFKSRIAAVFVLAVWLALTLAPALLAASDSCPVCNHKVCMMQKVAPKPACHHMITPSGDNQCSMRAGACQHHAEFVLFTFQATLPNVHWEIQMVSQVFRENARLIPAPTPFENDTPPPRSEIA